MGACYIRTLEMVERNTVEYTVLLAYLFILVLDDYCRYIEERRYRYAFALAIPEEGPLLPNRWAGIRQHTARR